MWGSLIPLWMAAVLTTTEDKSETSILGPRLAKENIPESSWSNMLEEEAEEVGQSPSKGTWGGKAMMECLLARDELVALFSGVVGGVDKPGFVGTGRCTFPASLSVAVSDRRFPTLAPIFGGWGPDFPLLPAAAADAIIRD